MELVSDEAKEFFRYYNEVFRVKYGWPKLPIGIGFWSYNAMVNLVKAWDEPWPTWPELEAGLDATGEWHDADGVMVVRNPYWLVKAKVIEDGDASYPNILMLKNFAAKGGSGSANMMREFQG